MVKSDKRQAMDSVDCSKNIPTSTEKLIPLIISELLQQENTVLNPDTTDAIVKDLSFLPVPDTYNLKGPP